MKKKIKQSKTCYIERGWYYGNAYRYIDCKTSQVSRDFNYITQCVETAHYNGYTIIDKDKR